MTATIPTDQPVSSNGSSPHAAEAAIASLRRRPLNIHLARGFGPLLVAIVLFLLMLWIAPSVAPERIVQRPATSSPSVTIPSTTAPTAPTSASASTTPTSAAQPTTTVPPTTTAGATP